MAAPMLAALGRRLLRGPPVPLWEARAGYNARRLGLDLSGFYLPDDASPEWRRGPRAQRQLYGRWGSASGVEAASLWAQASDLAAHQAEWEPSLQQMLSDLRAREQERLKKQREREKLIAANMAKMPKMMADWRREKRELKVRQKEEKARKERLLSEARERFGYSIDPRSSKFQEMVKELEKEEKKKRKLLKRRQREESAGTEVTAATTTGAP